MKLKKSLLLGITALSLGTSVSLIGAQPVNAMSIYNSGNPFWNRLPWVTLKHNVRVHKMRIVTPNYKSYSVGVYVAKKGYHYRLGHWGNNYSWTLESGRFKGNHHYSYVVAKGANNHSWFRFGIH